MRNGHRFGSDAQGNGMGKRKKNGRGRGRYDGRGPGPGGGGGGGGGGNVGGRTHGGRPRPVHRRYDSDNGPGPYPDQEPTENGEPGPLEPGGGVLELHPNGYGFLRNPDNNLHRERTDPFVPGTMIEKFRLREGVRSTAWCSRPPAARPAAERDHRRRRDEARRLSQRQNVRLAYADQSGKLAPPGNRPAAADHPGDGPAHAAGQGPTGPDRRSAANRQDDSACSRSARRFRPTIPTSSWSCCWSTNGRKKSPTCAAP